MQMPLQLYKCTVQTDIAWLNTTKKKYITEEMMTVTNKYPYFVTSKNQCFLF